MGGRGSSFNVSGKNEINAQLFNTPTSLTGTIYYKDNDKETQLQNEETIKLKKRANIIVFESTDVINKNFLKTNIKSINNHLEHNKLNYNIHYKYFINTDKNKHGSIKAAYVPDTVRAFVVIGDNQGVSVVYNTKYFEAGQEQKTLLNLDREIKAGEKAYVPRNKRSIYTTTHELGHVVQLAMYKKETGVHSIDRNFRQYAKNERDFIVDLARTKYKSKATAVSLYATTNGAEWFAETYTSLMLNGPITPITKALDEYLRKKGADNHGR